MHSGIEEYNIYDSATSGVSLSWKMTVRGVIINY